jgi:hypothetical protein
LLFDDHPPTGVYEHVVSIPILASDRVVAVRITLRGNHLIARLPLKRNRRLEIFAYGRRGTESGEGATQQGD